MPAHAQHARLEGGGGSGGIPRTGSGAPGAGGKAHANGGLESAPIEEQVGTVEWGRSVGGWWMCGVGYMARA